MSNRQYHNQSTGGQYGGQQYHGGGGGAGHHYGGQSQPQNQWGQNGSSNQYQNKNGGGGGGGGQNPNNKQYRQSRGGGGPSQGGRDGQKNNNRQGGQGAGGQQTYQVQNKQQQVNAGAAQAKPFVPSNGGVGGTMPNSGGGGWDSLYPSKPQAAPVSMPDDQQKQMQVASQKSVKMSVQGSKVFVPTNLPQQQVFQPKAEAGNVQNATKFVRKQSLQDQLNMISVDANNNNISPQKLESAPVNQSQNRYADVDDAILSIDQEAPASKPPTFTNKNKKKDENKNLNKKSQSRDVIMGGHADFGGIPTGQKVSGKTNKNERELTKASDTWLAGAATNGEDNLGKSLNELDSSEKFDQFANRNTTYSESLYNTSYDITKLSKKQLMDADRIDQEIKEQDSKGNLHLAEERGQIMQRDNPLESNEEALYSGVIRQKQAKGASQTNIVQKPVKQLKNYKKFTGYNKVIVSTVEKLDTSINERIATRDQFSRADTKPAAIMGDHWYAIQKEQTLQNKGTLNQGGDSAPQQNQQSYQEGENTTAHHRGEQRYVQKGQQYQNQWQGANQQKPQYQPRTTTADFKNTRGGRGGYQGSYQPSGQQKQIQQPMQYSEKQFVPKNTVQQSQPFVPNNNSGMVSSGQGQQQNTGYQQQLYQPKQQQYQPQSQPAQPQPPQTQPTFQAQSMTFNPGKEFRPTNTSFVTNNMGVKQDEMQKSVLAQQPQSQQMWNYGATTFKPDESKGGVRGEFHPVNQGQAVMQGAGGVSQINQQTNAQQPMMTMQPSMQQQPGQYSQAFLPQANQMTPQTTTFVYQPQNMQNLQQQQNMKMQMQYMQQQMSNGINQQIQQYNMNQMQQMQQQQQMQFNQMQQIQQVQQQQQQQQQQQSQESKWKQYSSSFEKAREGPVGVGEGDYTQKQQQTFNLGARIFKPQ